MTLSPIKESGVKTKPEQSEVKQDDVVLVEGWELFSADDFYETRDLAVFNYFLNSKGTNNIEIANLKTDTFTLIVKGDAEKNGAATVLFHQLLTNVKRSDRIDLVQSVLYQPGIGNITKNRLGASLATYFGVEKELE